MKINVDTKRTRCNGYYHICKYKGVPVIELEYSDKIKGNYCKECCKNYIKQHPDLPKELKEGIATAVLMNEAIKSKVEQIKKSENFTQADKKSVS